MERVRPQVCACLHLRTNTYPCATILPPMPPLCAPPRSESRNVLIPSKVSPRHIYLLGPRLEDGFNIVLHALLLKRVVHSGLARSLIKTLITGCSRVQKDCIRVSFRIQPAANSQAALLRHDGRKVFERTSDGLASAQESHTSIVS